MRTPRHRLASLGDTKEKCSLLFGFARDQFLLKRKGHFSLVFCPPSIRAGGGATILFARAWRNSPHTPLPPCPRSDGLIFRWRHQTFDADILLSERASINTISSPTDSFNSVRILLTRSNSSLLK